MIAYGVAILIAALFGEVASRANNRRMRVALLAASAVPMVFLAAMRAETSGTDIYVYLRPLYWKSLEGGLIAALKFGVEPLFAALVWLATRLTGTLAGVMGLVELASLLPILIVIEKKCMRCAGVSIFCYGVMYYLFGLNCMRQNISISFMLLACVYLFDGNGKRCLILGVVSGLFHVTAFLGMIFLPIFCIVKRCLRDDRRGVKKLLAFVTLCCILMVVVLVFHRKIIVVASMWKESFKYQLEHMDSTFELVEKGLVYPVVLTVLVSALRKQMKRPEEVITLLICLWMGAFLWQLASVSSQLYRLGMIFQIYSVLLIPRILEAASDLPMRLSISLLLMVAASFFCFKQYIEFGYAGTIPYVSSLFPVLNL